MGSMFVKKLRAIMLSAICLLFSIQINSNISDVDLAPQLKKANVEQVIEYEDYLYQHHTVSNLSGLAAKKRYVPKA